MTVSFNKQQERIKVPFAALSAFVDPIGALRPAVRPQGQGRGGADKTEAAAAAPTPLPAPDKRPPLGAPRPARGQARGRTSHRRAAAKPEDAASKIVKLDSFRKK